MGAGDVLQLLDVLQPGLRAAVALLEDGLAELTDAADLGRWRQAFFVRCQVGEHLAERFEGFLGSLVDLRRRGDERLQGIGACLAQADRGDDRTRPGGADAVKQLQDAEPADFVARVFQQAQKGQDILNMGRLEELQPAELDERNIAAGQLQLQQVAVVAGAASEQVSSTGRAPPDRTGQRFLGKRSRA